uniref:Large surface protein PCAN_A1.28.3 n=1 Tax=Pneumocystis canis TaxID=2698477 RepID=A0A7S5W3Z7_9ASCO|nr:large surface protein PCAN_A1.28.3 [Pneumocystis canis]
MLKKRDQGKGEEMEEEHFLALILKGNVREDNCKTELGKYCKSLHAAELESKQIHEKLKDVCEKDGNVKDKDKKCKDLKGKVEGKCETLKKGLDEVLKERPVKSNNCTQYESQCLFLGACSEDVTEKCSEVGNKCYLMRRVKVAGEVLVRALSGSLKKKENKNEEKCIEDLKKHCPILGRMSHELMEKCLNPEETCKSLITEAGNKCTSLKDKVKKAVENVKDDSCLPLLEECYFYGPNCEETKCEELRTQCEDEHDIVYIPPEQPWFPIQPKVSIIEEVGLERLYKAIAEEGILINKLKLPSIDDLLFFFSQKNDNNGEFDKEKCKAQQGNCDYLKTLSKNSDYNCNGLENKCTELEKKFKKRRDDLKEDIKDARLFGGNDGDTEPVKSIPWHKLYPEFNGESCPRLESECFYLDKNDKSDFEKACKNVRNMCYKRGLDAAAYETLESRMRGEFLDSRANWPNQCQKKLIDVCEKLKDEDSNLLSLCLQPEKTCNQLKRDILKKANQLVRDLETVRDSPQEEDCKIYKKECDSLKEDNTWLFDPCYTLERNCYHLRESQKMRNLLLEERQNYFEDIENCTSILDKKCQNWSRKINKQFSLSCALQNDTCRIMSFNTSLQCDNLIKNINGKEIVNTLNEVKGNMDELRELCPTWLPYCNALLPNCAKELAEGNNDTLCPGIQKYCKPYQERQAVEDAAIYEFRGYLTNNTQCMFKLDGYCTQGIKLANKTLKGLCTNISDKDNSEANKTIREKLCKRLVKKVRRWCKTLYNELKEAKEELTDRVATYEKLKKEAEEKAKKTNVILTFSIENDTTNKTNTTSHALVKRSQSYPTITETEAYAFDLVAMVITEYVDLKEKCEKLLLDCGFKKECPESETPCTKIEKSCSDLKPLEMRPPQTITNTETSTSTVTQNVTVDSQGKPICTAGTPSISMNCTSIHTTETWVTHTSTHTSTMTKTSTVTSKVTIVSTKKCQPTQCTTDRTYPTHGSGGEEAGDVKPSGGIRVNGWGTNGMILMILFSMIYF